MSPEEANTFRLSHTDPGVKLPGWNPSFVTHCTSLGSVSSFLKIKIILLLTFYGFSKIGQVPEQWLPKARTTIETETKVKCGLLNLPKD